MKKILFLNFGLFISLFAYNGLYGTRGGTHTFSAFSEKMGVIYLNANTIGYYEHIIRPPESYNFIDIFPYVSVSVTPWHYIEFSGFASGYSFYNTTNTHNTYGLQDIGGIVKGILPILKSYKLSFNFSIVGLVNATLTNPINYSNDSLIAQEIGYQPFIRKDPEFGGLGLFGFALSSFRFSFGVGYIYRNNHYILDSSYIVGPIIPGTFLIEFTLIKPVNIFSEAKVNYILQSQYLDLDVSGGLNLGLSGGPFLFNINIGGGLNPMSYSTTSYALFGISIGFDFMPPLKAFKGLVLDKNTGEPVAEALVKVEGTRKELQTLTDSSGIFVFKDYKADQGIMMVKKEGYIEKRISSEDIPKKTVKLEIEKQPYTKFFGFIYDKYSKTPLRASALFVTPEGKNLFIETDPVSGYFEIALKKGLYTLNISSEGYISEHYSLRIDKNDTLYEFYLTKHKPVKTKTVKKPKCYTKRIFFSRSSTKIDYGFYPILDNIVNKALKGEIKRISITGHTDAVGSSSKNYRIALKRAYNVYNYLIEKGVPYNIINYSSSGETRPIGDNRRISGRRLNRRVDINITE